MENTENEEHKNDKKTEKKILIGFLAFEIILGILMALVVWFGFYGISFEYIQNEFGKKNLVLIMILYIATIVIFAFKLFGKKEKPKILTEKEIGKIAKYRKILINIIVLLIAVEFITYVYGIITGIMTFSILQVIKYLIYLMFVKAEDINVRSGGSLLLLLSLFNVLPFISMLETNIGDLWVTAPAMALMMICRYVWIILMLIVGIWLFVISKRIPDEKKKDEEE